MLLSCRAFSSSLLVLFPKMTLFLSCRPLAQLLAVYVLRCIMMEQVPVASSAMCGVNLSSQEDKLVLFYAVLQKNHQGFSLLPRTLLDGLCMDQALCNISAMLKKTALPKWSSCYIGNSQNSTWNPLLFAQPPPSSYPSYDFKWRNVFSTGCSSPGTHRNKGRATASCRVWCPFGISVSGKQLKPQELVSYSHSEKALEEAERK